MDKLNLTLMGMNCGHCIASVRRTLGAIDGVSVEEVKINSAIVAIDESKASLNQVSEALGEVGYPMKAATKAA